VLSVDVASLDTANARRDTHLRSGNFFDAERFPTITFSAGSVSIEPSRSTVTGVLEIGEAIVSLQVPVEIEQRPAGCVRLSGSVDISLDSVGLGWNRLGVIGRTAKLHADLTLQQQL
jgi:polyisoprenoid-binding protein YceI